MCVCIRSWCEAGIAGTLHSSFSPNGATWVVRELSGAAWHSGALLTAPEYRGFAGLLINTATLTNHHNYDLMRGGERIEGKEVET